MTTVACRPWSTSMPRSGTSWHTVTRWNEPGSPGCAPAHRRPPTCWRTPRSGRRRRRLAGVLGRRRGVGRRHLLPPRRARRPGRRCTVPPPASALAWLAVGSGRTAPGRRTSRWPPRRRRGRCPATRRRRLYLTADAGFWLDRRRARRPGRRAARPPRGRRRTRAWSPRRRRRSPARCGRTAPGRRSWPPAGWAAALLHRQEFFYESARMQLVLGDRLPEMSPADVAWMAAALRRVGLAATTGCWCARARRLAETQRSDGGWDSDDGAAST